MIAVPASVPEVLEKGMLSEVFYRGRMTSQCKLQEQIFVSGGKMLIIATNNYSNIHFSGIIKFTDAKTFP